MTQGTSSAGIPAASRAGTSTRGTPLDYGGLHRLGAFHTFRHTCASMLFHSGRNIRQVSDWLGHHDPAFTMRTYVGLLDEGVGSADVFDKLIPA
jgi:integrase